MRGRYGVTEFAGRIAGAYGGGDISGVRCDGERDNYSDGDSVIHERNCERAISGRRKEFWGGGDGFTLLPAAEHFYAEQWDAFFDGDCEG